MKVYNGSPFKAAVHTEGDTTYRAEPGLVTELPESVAHAMVSQWPGLEIREEKPIGNEVVWEMGLGPLYEKAKLEFGFGAVVKETVGPDTPPVVEPPQLKDDPTGSPNTHGCSYCGQDFDKITALRKHQKNVHAV